MQIARNNRPGLNLSKTGAARYRCDSEFGGGASVTVQC